MILRPSLIHFLFRAYFTSVRCSLFAQYVFLNIRCIANWCRNFAERRFTGVALQGAALFLQQNFYRRKKLMNKCTKCGAEFEGNFCPHCGARYQQPDVCPKCGTTHRSNERFCSNCGYDFELQATAPQIDDEVLPQSAPSGVNWRKPLKYLPVLFFGLWAALLWAFFSSNFVQGDIYMKSITFYNLLSDGNIAQAMPILYVLVALAALADIYAIILLFVYLKGKKQTAATVFCYLFYVAIIVCAIVATTQFFNGVAGSGLEEMKGNFDAVVIALTVVFALLHGASLFVAHKFGSSNNVVKTTVKKASTRPAVPQREDKLSGKPVLHALLKFAPLTLFALWAVLLWAFYAAPLMKGDGFFLDDVNLYHVFEERTMLDLHATCYALIGFAAIVCILAAVFAFVQFKCSNRAKRIVNFASFALYLAVLICTIVLSVQFQNDFGGIEDVTGSLVGVVIAFTVIFAAAHIAAFVMNILFGLLPQENISAQGRSDAPNSVRSRLKKQKIECVFGGAMCLACVVLGILFEILTKLYIILSNLRYGYYYISTWIYFSLVIKSVFYGSMIVAGCYTLKKQLRKGFNWTLFATIWCIVTGILDMLLNFSTWLLVVIPSVIALINQSITLKKARRKIEAEIEAEVETESQTDTTYTTATEPQNGADNVDWNEAEPDDTVEYDNTMDFTDKSDIVEE